MARTRTLLLVAGVIAAAPSAAQMQPGGSPSRGELLYATHCIACHTTEIHWRQKKLATDWASLEAQVRRWAGNGGLGWSDDEIADVARYLNASQYRFEAPSRTILGDRPAPRPIARAD